MEDQDKAEVMKPIKDTLEVMLEKAPEQPSGLAFVLFKGIKYLEKRIQGPDYDPLYYSGVGK